tara:strand:- start:3117 stop:4199 length:1083 start_codon:yes stop_codon:yes gene_type:complete
MIEQAFWQSRRVFITGHTGFKGSWLCIWLRQLGAEVKGFSLEPETTPSLFQEAKVAEIMESEIGDIRNLDILQKSMSDFRPDIVIHMAAQPLVRYSYQAPIETYSTNVLGTAHFLQAALSCSTVRSVINVTTDKCYDNKEWLWAYRENEPIGGHDPYSSSKGCSELVTASYRKSFYEKRGIGLATARAGNVVGGGDWGFDRLIPDILRAFEKSKPAIIRNPTAIRPWQHVLEPLSGYLTLARALYESPNEFAEAWNFGPNEDGSQTVNWIIDEMIRAWPGAKWQLDKSNDNPHEANYLKLDISKAKSKLLWSPIWSLDITLNRIINWHKSWLAGKNMQKVTLTEIKDFMKSIELNTNERY